MEWQGLERTVQPITTLENGGIFLEGEQRGHLLNQDFKNSYFKAHKFLDSWEGVSSAQGRMKG